MGLFYEKGESNFMDKFKELPKKVDELFDSKEPMKVQMCKTLSRLKMDKQYLKGLCDIKQYFQWVRDRCENGGEWFTTKIIKFLPRMSLWLPLCSSIYCATKYGVKGGLTVDKLTKFAKSKSKKDSNEKDAKSGSALKVNPAGLVGAVGAFGVSYWAVMKAIKSLVYFTGNESYQFGKHVYEKGFDFKNYQFNFQIEEEEELDPSDYWGRAKRIAGKKFKQVKDFAQTTNGKIALGVTGAALVVGTVACKMFRSSKKESTESHESEEKKSEPKSRSVLSMITGKSDGDDESSDS